MPVTLPDAMLTVAGALFGGVGVKVIDNFFSVRKDRLTLAATESADLRKEMRADILELKKESDALRHELDEWKEKYYAVFSEHASLKSMHEATMHELVELRREVSELKNGKEQKNGS